MDSLHPSPKAILDNALLHDCYGANMLARWVKSGDLQLPAQYVEWMGENERYGS